MSAKKLLELLEKKGQLEAPVLAELRKQLAESKQNISTEAVAKALVDRGHLTKFQATKLVGEVAAMGGEQPTASTPARPDPDDELEMVPYDDEEESPRGAPSMAGAESGSVEDDDIVLLEDAGGLTPVEDAGAGLTPVGHAAEGLTSLAPEPGDLDPLGGIHAGTGDPFGAAQAGAAPIYVPRRKKQTWDTKLILGGVLALLILLLVGAVLVWNFTAVPAKEMFAAAEKAYHEQAYSDARQRYEDFLQKYPKDDSASLARVRTYLIRIRQDANDPERALTTAKEVLPQIAAEKAAEAGREEFPGLLPQIPEGFVQRARQSRDTSAREELLAKAKEGMALINDPEYITTKRRTPILPQVNRIHEEIELVERAITEEKELASAIVEIGEAEQGGNTVQAFKRYHQLVRGYPRVRDDQRLREAVARISARERQLVRVVEEPLLALKADEARASEYRVVLANRTGPGSPIPRNSVATILASGSVYALNTGNGQVLWSRFVGYASQIQPIRVSQQADADVLIVDAEDHELVRVRPQSGELVWRLPIGEPFSGPTVSGPRMYVATNSGRVLEIDTQTGTSQRHVTIPQRLSLPPAAAPDQPYLFQIGEHSNVYVLSADTLQCEDVIYLGHQAGTVAVPPLLLMGHLFVAENFRSDSARVHCLKLRGAGDGPRAFATQAALDAAGRVVVPLVVYNRRLLILTDRGEIRVFDVDLTKDENSVTSTGRLPPTLKEPVIGFPLSEGMTLWVADNKLAKYTVQVTRKEITRDSAITAAGDTFLASPQVFGNQLVHARRVARSNGVTVTCVEVDNPRQVVWQTRLGVPAGRIAVNAATNEIVAISSGASLYQINRKVLEAGYTDTPLMSAVGATTSSFDTPIEFENNVVAFFSHTDPSQLLVYDPSAGAAALRVVSLRIGDAKVPRAVAFRGGLLTPSDSGAVLLLKLSDGNNQLLPFQPKLEPGDKFAWRRPAVLDPDGREFVIVDHRQNIYRVGVKDQPTPHLAELRSGRLEIELSTGLAAAGDTLYGVVRSGAGDVVVAISPTDLQVVKEWDLGRGRVTWGPERVGNVVMVVTDEKELRCYGPGQTQLWAKPAIMHGQPAGHPLVVGDDYVFASINGSIWRLTGAEGEATARAELGEPLGAGPVAFGGRLLLCGNDGSLHVVPMPTAGAGG